jgi:cytochrome c oxidase subunit 2
MGLYVFAEPRAQFDAWLAKESKRAPAAASAGRDEFLHGACASCHAIRGTNASGDVGPDLTHVAGRTTIGALVLPNGRAELSEWIRDSQRFKPGNHMPSFPQLSSSQLADLVAYLESLK